MTKSIGMEIERKFFVDDNSFLADAYSKSNITQYYLEINDNGSTRIRSRDGVYTHTVKKATDVDGVFLEDEKEITRSEFLSLKEKAISYIAKTRYKVKASDGFVWEIDDYGNGLVIAEVELPDIDTPIIIPDFIGNELTGDKEYSNASLSKMNSLI